MKIALCSSSVPFVNGGYRNIVDWLEPVLVDAGHEVERIYIPEVDDPRLLVTQMMAFRWLDLDAADRLICFRPMAHLIPHPNKVVWFIHHIRTFYDLWDSEYRWFPDDTWHRSTRDIIRSVDSLALSEARKVFTNSKVVADRLKSFNNLDSQVLYPPVSSPDRFYCGEASDEIIYISRLEHHKRQHLLIDAFEFVKSGVRLRLCGQASVPEYSEMLQRRVEALGVGERVVVENRWITEVEKQDLLAGSLACAYLPLDEDSFGYPSAEASLSSKAILTANDSGGVLELVTHERNGLVVEPTAMALAAAMDQLFLDRRRTAAMGQQARERLNELGISWENVLDRLLE
jgi:glycosyltransferase involved in cell wall biosynthesis